MNRTAKRPFTWQLNWKILLFTGIFLPITLWLGFWQLDRAAEKKQLLSVYNARQNSDPVLFSSVNDVGDRQFLRVKVLGKIRRQPVLLLDNKIRHSQPGYEVLVIVDTLKGPLLVNRGWIAGGLDRSIKPVVPPLIVQSDAALTGYLYLSPGKQIMLGEDRWAASTAFAVVQNASPSAVGEVLGEKMYPYILRLDHSQSELEAQWPIINVQPEKHTGYAVQWFAIASALVVLSLFANSNIADWLKARRR